MVKAGRVREIWRYPVKGMAGERLESCSVSERGIDGDRTWALRDASRGEVQSCKTRPALLTCSARASEDGDGEVVITFPDGTMLVSDDDRVHERLSALTGKASTLEPLRPAADADFYRRHKVDDHTWFKELAATFDREPGEPLPDFNLDDNDFANFVSRPGTFFLVTPLHLLTTASLDYLGELNPAGDWDARRFRPNFLIEPDEACTGLLEQDWVGKRLVIGGAAMDCVDTTPRCGAITRPQRDFAADTGILRTVVNEADQNVGVYGETVTSGVVNVGDTVWLD
ncbi:MAG: MOSC domain-containing protein [Guyparkeria sp.]